MHITSVHYTRGTFAMSHPVGIGELQCWNSLAAVEGMSYRQVPVKFTVVIILIVLDFSLCHMH